MVIEGILPERSPHQVFPATINAAAIQQQKITDFLLV
jgi:hypothetical protein